MACVAAAAMAGVGALAGARLARVTDAVQVGVELGRVRHCGADVDLVGHAIPVPVAIAHVADAIAVGVDLRRICDERAVVGGVRDGIPIGVGVTVVGYAVRVGIERMVGIGADLVAVRDPVV